MLIDIDYGEAVAKLKRQSDFLIQHLEAKEWAEAYSIAAKMIGYLSVILTYLTFVPREPKHPGDDHE